MNLKEYLNKIDSLGTKYNSNILWGTLNINEVATTYEFEHPTWL